MTALLDPPTYTPPGSTSRLPRPFRPKALMLGAYLLLTVAVILSFVGVATEMYAWPYVGGLIALLALVAYVLPVSRTAINTGFAGEAVVALIISMILVPIVVTLGVLGAYGSALNSSSTDFSLSSGSLAPNKLAPTAPDFAEAFEVPESTFTPTPSVTLAPSNNLSSGEDCGNGVTAVGTTSCPFAVNVAYDFSYYGNPNTKSSQIQTYSPVTDEEIDMNCVRGTPTVCTGGRAAVVYIEDSYDVNLDPYIADPNY